MAEYLKYKNKEIKIGTMESLYYVTYPKYIAALQRGHLSPMGGTSPNVYVAPEHGFRFRFPFPDEDKLGFGDISESYDRGVPVTISNAAIPYHGQNGNSEKLFYQMEITAQKLIRLAADQNPFLAVVYRDPVKREYFRVEDEASAVQIVKQIIANNISNEPDPARKNFYRQVASRILQGYRMGHALQNTQEKSSRPEQKKANNTIPFSKPKRKFGKGL